MTEKFNYKSLCEEAIETLDVRIMVVYTGDIINSLPVFKMVHPVLACSFYLGKERKELWGIVAVDSANHTTQWYNYNDCVSLEGWRVLERMLDARFAWMRRIDGLREEIIKTAKMLVP